MTPSRKSRRAKRRPTPTRRERAPSAKAAELGAAKRRAHKAKTILAAVGACVFGTAMVFARHSYAGHQKQPATSLAAPPRFVSVVRRNLLQAGVVAPAQAPPGAATAAS
jgi:hypothetical protein